MHPVRAAERPGVDEVAVRRYVGVWVVLALVAAVAVLRTTGDGGLVEDPRGLVLAWLACLVAGVVHVPLPVRGTLESSTLSELAHVPVVLLLAPPDALLAVVLAALLSELWLVRLRVERLLFNVAWATTGVGVAALARTWLLPGPFEPGLRGLAAAVLVAVVVVAVNHVAFTGLVVLRSGGRWPAVLRDQLPSAATINLGTGLVGGVAAVLVVAAPWSLVLLLAPIAVQRVLMGLRGRGQVRLADERARLERTVDGASDGITLLDPDGRVEVWNPVMVTLTGVDGTVALGRTLAELGLGSVVSAIDGGPSRVTMDGRVVEARARRVGSVEDVGLVVTLRDVTREDELDRIREDVVSLVSHELRTPVTTLTGFLVTLDAHWDELDDERRHALLGAARRGGDRLGSLVANVVAWARVERRVSDGASTGTCRVGTVLDDVLTVLGTQVERHGDLDAVVALEADELATVLRNLVENALAYGAPPVRVEVEREPAAGRVLVHVVDHGPGLPASFRPALFEPWQQATTGLRRTARGIGMGLAVSRAVVEVAGGSIDHADVPGGGSRFSVSLPAG